MDDGLKDSSLLAVLFYKVSILAVLYSLYSFCMTFWYCNLASSLRFLTAESTPPEFYSYPWRPWSFSIEVGDFNFDLKFVSVVIFSAFFSDISKLSCSQSYSDFFVYPLFFIWGILVIESVFVLPFEKDDLK